MIGLTPALLAGFTSEVAAMMPLEFWARIHPDRDDLRFSAHRRRDGSWQLTLEEYDESSEELAKQGVWRAVMDGWVRDEHPSLDGVYYLSPTALCERFVTDPECIEDAVYDLFNLSFGEDLDLRSHPGALFLNWVWGECWRGES